MSTVGWPARAALALFGLAGASCGAIGSSEVLTDAQQLIADMKIGPSNPTGANPTGADLKIIGGVERKDRRYRVGEPVMLSVQVNKAAFVAVLRVMPNGATTLVFPNRQRATTLVAANSLLRIPEPEAPFRIIADRPGVVLFEFVASTSGDSWLFSRRPAGSADFAELGATTRTLAKYIVTSLKVGRGPEAAASHLTITVQAD